MSLTPRLDKLERNYIINGNFDFWQRGTNSGIIADASKRYLADRMYYFANGNVPTPNFTLTRTTDIPTNHIAQFSARLQRNSGNTNISTHILGQAIESNFCRNLRGKHVTVTFYAKCGANYSAASSALFFRIDTGTGIDQDPGNAYTDQVPVVDANVTLTTSWQKFTITTTSPINIDINEMRAFFRFTPVGTAGADDSFYITGFCLVEGQLEDPEFTLAGRNYAEELQLCRRYFEKSWSPDVAPGTGVDAGAVHFVSSNGSPAGTAMYFTYVTKRISPVIKIYSTDGTINTMRNASNGTNLAAGPRASVTNARSSAGENSASGISGNVYNFHWTADAEL